jgi:hypothetical protein
VAKHALITFVRGKQGAGYEAFINSKVLAIAGDITLDGLGLSPADREFVEAEVQVMRKPDCCAPSLSRLILNARMMAISDIAICTTIQL